MGDALGLMIVDLLLMIEKTKKVNHDGAKDAKRVLCCFVQILEERFRIRAHQALTGGNRIDDRNA